MIKHSRNFGIISDQISELGSLLKLATAMGVNLHINWNRRFPHQWQLDFIENKRSEPGSGSYVLMSLIDAAELHRKEIVAFAQNMTDSRLPPEEWVLRWYEKHGFIRTYREEHGVGIRRPRSP